jgi:hypothetical protein
MQLEVGSVATTFEQRPYGMELALCQRYYETIVQPGSMGPSCIIYQASFIALGYQQYRVQKRATPTIPNTAGRIVAPSAIGIAVTLTAMTITDTGVMLATTITITSAGAGWFDDYTLSISAEL